LDGALESLDRRQLFRCPFRDSIPQLAPIRESILARQHELCVSEREIDLVRQLGSHAGDGLAVSSTEFVQEILGEFLLLFEVWTCGKGTAKCGRHGGLLR
jgi:hypothetical protein